MVNLLDLRDIDRVLCRGREKFDLGFTCDCQKGWCALMNNPEGIQNPGVSATPLLVGLADSEVRLVAVTCGVSSSEAPVSVCSSTSANMPGEMRAREGRLGRQEELTWNMLDVGLAWSEASTISASVSLGEVKTVWPQCTPSTSTSENQMQVGKAGKRGCKREGCSCLVTRLAKRQDRWTITAYCICNRTQGAMITLGDVRRG